MTINDNLSAADSEAVQQNDKILYQGFRLSRFSLLNWGTFDEKVFTLSPQQENSLLTGNIGSGKSTLVDGLTTLLVPTRKLSFNKAAGAEEKERSLESYFHGHYTSQQDENGKARAVGLRQDKHYSVLLAEFYAASIDETVTIAQLIWLKPGEKKVKRLFVVAPQSLTIEKHFSSFGTQISQLKKRLKKNPDIQLFDTFPPYSQAFSKLLGLGADGKALELFNQTISMKSVGSVTDFVRQNMLEKPDIETQLKELERNYDDLKRLHDAVVAARKKVELLKPVSDFGEQAIAAAKERQHTDQCRNLIDQYMAGLAITLYQSRLQKRRLELDKIHTSLERLKQGKLEQDQAIVELKNEIQNNGGGRIQQLENELLRKVRQRDDSLGKYQRYQLLTKSLQLSDELSADTFINNQNKARNLAEENNLHKEKLEDELFVKKSEHQQLSQQAAELNSQLQSLKQRETNINLRQIQIRTLIAERLGVNENKLPFAGELIQVKKTESLWQGAIERVLHNFALSMIVPDELYSGVSQLVEETHLGTRLVYYRVKDNHDFIRREISPRSLLNKVEIKPDSDHYDWLHKELQQRFDYECCEQLDDFRRSEKAISLNGQIKTGKFRHEKDDRHNLNDKSRYVLGWSNKEKIALLLQQATSLHQQQEQLKQILQKLKEKTAYHDQQRYHALRLADFDVSFDEMNWPHYSREIKDLEDEKQLIEQSSDILQQLNEKLKESQQQLLQTEEKLQNKLIAKGEKQTQISDDEEELSQKQSLLNTVEAALKEHLFPAIETFYQHYFPDQKLEIRSLSQRSSEFKQKLNIKVQNLEEKRRKKEHKMIEAMGNFAHHFPNDVLELDKSPQALPEYQKIYKQLLEEDLPRHEERFKEMLNRDTIRAMTLFWSHLDKQVEEIDARILLINKALHELDYQPGTYIEIERIVSPDIEVRDFKQRLKQCVEYSSDENLYSEDKFIRVKDLIEQMRNEPKWTQKVVDVRFWHLFNVTERYREDQSEKECYSDSGGKSGGQKEKLAYSILAAAILLQYGLVDNSYRPGINKSRRFNLVVIDEAFARGSKDSTRFGLELFKKLGLQLMLVTPLQKLDVIEHYVKHVHFVDQKNKYSMLLNMSIEEYRQKLGQHQKMQQLKSMIAVETV